MLLLLKPYGPTRITKDGVTVCKSIFFIRCAENEGAKMMINASEKTIEMLVMLQLQLVLLLKQLQKKV